jgi:hypothetical protein
MIDGTIKLDNNSFTKINGVWVTETGREMGNHDGVSCIGSRCGAEPFSVDVDFKQLQLVGDEWQLRKGYRCSMCHVMFSQTFCLPVKGHKMLASDETGPNPLHSIVSSDHGEKVTVFYAMKGEDRHCEGCGMRAHALIKGERDSRMLCRACRQTSRESFEAMTAKEVTPDAHSKTEGDPEDVEVDHSLYSQRGRGHESNWD